jgi:hypothetical protein
VRVRFVAAVGAAWLLALAARAAFVHGPSGLPEGARDVATALGFGVAMLGFVVQRFVLLPGDPSATVICLLGAAYIAATSVLAFKLPRAERTRLLLAQLYLALTIAAVAVKRFTLLPSLWRGPGFSHYHYLTALGWTTPLALAIAWASRRRPRGALGVSLAAIALASIAHAHFTLHDRGPFSPRERRDVRSAEIVERLVATARAAQGPLYDAGLPRSLAWPEIRAHDVVAVVAPETSVSWTLVATPESLLPYASDPLLRKSLEIR